MSNAQFFSVFDIDTKDYPLVHARYMYLNDSGRQVYHINESALQIFENEEEAKIVSIKDPQKSPPKKLSVVLTFDVSSSMDEERLQIAKAAGLKFIELLPLELSECAISSFDHKNYLNSDFTHSAERLRKAIHSLKPGGGTNYDSGLITPYSGSFQIAKEGKYKKVVIFLTDGLGEGNKPEIVRQAQKENISVYTVSIGLKIPQILKDIAINTGGQYFEEVTDTTEAKKIYHQILINAQTVEPGMLTWRSPGGCNPNIHARFSYRNTSMNSFYKLNNQQVVSLGINPVFVQFDSAGSRDSREIEMTAVNADFTIQDVELGNKSNFSINPIPETPFKLNKNARVKFNLSYRPSSQGKAFSTITVTNDQCPDYYIYAKGGKETASAGLKLLSPNGGEVFSAGIRESVKWKGIAKRDTVSVYFSSDRGKNWNLLKPATGLNDEWEIPAITGNDNLLKIEQTINRSAIQGIEPLLGLSGEDYSAHNARFVGNGQYILTIEDNQALKLWDASTGKFIRTIRLHSDWVYDATPSPDGEKIVTASDDGSAKVFHIGGGKSPQKLSVNYSGINKAIFSNDGQEVITAGDDGSVRIWDPYTGRHKYGILAHSGWALDVDLSPNGNIIASAGDDRVIRTWNFNARTSRNRVHRETFEGHKGWVMDVEFSPDGKKILSASKDGTARIWDAYTGDLLHTFYQHRGEVYSASYTPDGSKILTAGRDGTVRIWDAITKKQIDIIRADKNQWFRRAYFGPQGNQILTINNDRRVKVWIMNSPKPFQKDESDKPFRIISPKPSLTNVDFGELAPGRSLDSLVKKFYHNPTEHPVKITGTFVAGEDKKDFSVVRGYRSFVLPPNETRDIELNHTPHSNGSKNAYVGVVTPTDTIKATLTGRTVKPGYDVPVDRLNFGSLDVDQDRDTTILLIENNKYSALKLRQLSIKGSGEDQFFIEDKAGEKTVQPRAKKRIKLRFHPLRRGRTNALLSFRVEDNTHTIQLFGEGYSPRTIHLTGKVLRKRDNKPLSAKIECYDLESNRLLKKTGSGQSGHYSLTMNPERKYRIVADKDDYVPGNLHLDFAQNFTFDSINRNIYLSSIDSGATVVLNNIFFAFNKARLTRDSKAELDRMSRFLEEYPDITVEISGHTDSIGSSQYNMNLSRERAEVVRKYLVESGIDAERITTKGYGETQPIADNETDRGRQQNRRVEFTITGYARSSGE